MNVFSLIYAVCAHAVGLSFVKDYCSFVLRALLHVPADLTSEIHPG